MRYFHQRFIPEGHWKRVLSLKKGITPGEGQGTCVKSVSLEPSQLPCLRTIARGTATAWEMRFLKARSSLEACEGVDQEAELLKACYSSLYHLGSWLVKIWRELANLISEFPLSDLGWTWHSQGCFIVSALDSVPLNPLNLGWTQLPANLFLLAFEFLSPRMVPPIVHLSKLSEFWFLSHPHSQPSYQFLLILPGDCFWDPLPCRCQAQEHGLSFGHPDSPIQPDTVARGVFLMILIMSHLYQNGLSDAQTLGHGVRWSSQPGTHLL